MPAATIIYGIDDPCYIVKTIREEMRLGNASFFAPLLDMQAWDPGISVPAFWAPEDLALLARTPPYDWSRHTAWSRRAAG